MGQRAFFDEFENGPAFVIRAHTVKTLLDVGCGGVGPSDFDQDGVLQITFGESFDLRRKSRRKQQGLPLFGQVTQDALQIGQKANVQHAVGLVQHHILNLPQSAILGLNVVEQAAWRGDQHLHARLQLQGLGLHVDATKHHGRAQLGVFGISFHVVSDLVSQLPCRCNHEGPHRVAGGGHAGVFVLEHFLQQRNGKRCRFARAGLCRTHHVTAFQYDGNRLGLNRRHRGVAGVQHRAQQLGVQRQGVKTRGDKRRGLSG